MAASATSGNQSGNPTPERGQLPRATVRFWWVAVVILLLAAALWVGVATNRVDLPAATPTTLATAISANATPARASIVAVATPSADEKAAWYLQQQTTEGDYCQCGGR